MATMRTLILGTAAGLMATSGAYAADLPIKAKPIEYMKICSAYGAGFFFIPGTDTCMKIGGYLRVDATFDGGVQGAPAWNGDAGQRNRYFDYFAARSRMLLSIDTRTATDYGVVRTFGQGRFQFSTLGNNTFNPNSINGSLPVAGSQLLDTPGGGVATIQFLFIQFAGFTFGQSASAYSSPWQGFPGNISDFLLGGQNNDTGVNNIQYTADFGNGITGTIGLDDPTVWDRTNVYNLSLPLNATLNTGNAYAGVHAPDVVGNIRIDQAWGLFQLSAAAHEVNASYNVLNAAGAPAGAVGLPGAAPIGASELSGHPDTSWGGAVMAALQIKNIPTGAGDDIKMDASYSKGATKYIISSASTSPSFAMFGGTSAPGAYQSIGFGATTDAVYLPVAAGGDGSLHLTEAFGVRGAFNHNWDPYWSSSLFGSYVAVRYDGAAKAFMCANYTTPAKAVSADYSCNPDFNFSQLGVITRWTPVKNLTFSAEFMWFHLDQKFQGTAVLGASAPKPTTRYEFSDQDAFHLQLRAQRNF
ncbi:porin [Bradyrhizobium sp. Ai1a-2]|uniref:porin n=1 Tax=Bradyrhizobium sp. Ai1a-2 TaxID=196490 RepID=UPI0003FB6828|nr:porin [Bradyrhizobium sp. Ai1a-2]